MSEFVVILLAALLTWLAVVGLGALLGRRRRALSERLAALQGAGGADPGAPPGGRALAAPLDRYPAVERLRQELWRAGVNLRPTDFLGLIPLCGLVLGGLSLALSGLVWLSLLAAGLGALAPVIALWRKQVQRRAAFEAQLPDGLSLITSSLRSGYSFLQALRMVAQEMPLPISQEAQRVVDEVGVGMTLDEALARLVRRMRSYDVDLMVTAISIQYQVGGNLAELLDTIGQTIRERFRNRREISALTAEGRLSGVILLLLPPVLMAVLLLRNPDYMRPLFEHPVGQGMLVGAIVLQVLGALIIRRMLAIDV